MSTQRCVSLRSCLAICYNSAFDTSDGLFPLLNFFSPDRRRGLVLTLSSFAGAIPSPLLATYSASKAFLQTWSDALQAELKETGVDVECVSTYFVV